MASLSSPLFLSRASNSASSRSFSVFSEKTFHPAMEFNTKVRRINAKENLRTFTVEAQRGGRGAAVLPSQAGAGHPLPQGAGLDPEGGGEGGIFHVFRRVVLGFDSLRKEGPGTKVLRIFIRRFGCGLLAFLFVLAGRFLSPFLRHGLPIFPFRRHTIFPLATSPSSCGARTTGFGLVSVDPTNTGRSPPCRTHPFPMSYPLLRWSWLETSLLSQDRNENERSTSHESG